MNICVVGAKERNTPQDKELVAELINKLAQEFPNPVFITMLTHTGVGRFVKEHCIEKRPDGKFKWQLITVDFRLYAVGLSQAELSQVYIARNASPFELGSAFVYFANSTRRGTMEDLIQRAEKAGIPNRIFMPGEPISTPIFG
jgi:hypothetical protein